MEALLTAVGAGEVAPADIPKHQEAIALTLEKEIKVKISDKGCVSVYGLQRFPVSLYPRQWERIFDADTKKKIVAGCEEAKKMKPSTEESEKGDGEGEDAKKVA